MREKLNKAAPRFESGGDLKELSYNKVLSVSKGVFTYHSPTKFAVAFKINLFF